MRILNRKNTKLLARYRAAEAQFKFPILDMPALQNQMTPIVAAGIMAAQSPLLLFPRQATW